MFDITGIICHWNSESGLILLTSALQVARELQAPEGAKLLARPECYRASPCIPVILGPSQLFFGRPDPTLDIGYFVGSNIR